LTESYSQGSTGNIVVQNAVKATWMISEAIVGGSNATVTLQWPQSLELTGFNRSFSRLSHYTGTTWDYGNSDIVATGTNPYSVTRTGFTSFSPFAISMFAALPVKWLSFTGWNEKNNNFLQWKTSNEENNNYFIIETSTNGTSFTEIERLNGNANTNNVQLYNFTHQDITGVINYYRIRQVDIVGRSSYSTTIKIQNAGLITKQSIFPNPVANRLSMAIQSQALKEINLIISDVSGRQVYQQYFSVDKGNNSFSIDFSKQVAGFYILQIIERNGVKHHLEFVKR
jgi:hypothetical protein